MKFRQFHYRVELIFCQLLLVLLVGSIGAQRYNGGAAGVRRNERRGLLYSPENYQVEQVACPSSTYNTFESWIGVTLDGELRTQSSDQDDFGILLLQAFRARSAMNCDPLQRAITAATFSLYGFDHGSAIYKVEAISYGSDSPPVLEPVPPSYLTFNKQPLGPVCTLSAIENSYATLYDSSGSCPFLGCYCASQLISSTGQTAGVTEFELAETMGAALELCQTTGIALNIIPRSDDGNPNPPDPEEPDLGGDYNTDPTGGKKISGKGGGRRRRLNDLPSNGKSKSGKGGTVESPTKSPTRGTIESPTKSPTRGTIESPTKSPTRGTIESPTKSPTRGTIEGPSKSPTRSPTRECLPLVAGIQSVMELKPIEPCEERVTFEADIVSVLSVDPCELSEDVRLQFLEELASRYNQAQFDACDSSFRRIVDFSLFENFCNSNNTQTDLVDYFEGGQRERRRLATSGYSSPFKFTVSTTKRTSTQVTNNKGRQGRQRRGLDEQEFVETSFGGSTRSGRKAAYKRRLNGTNETTADCFCSVFSEGPSDGISDDDFLELAKEAITTVTNGSVAVVDVFQATEGCPEGERTPARGGVTVYLNVDASSLSQEEICQLEQDCVLTFNNYVMEFCPRSYTQIRSCHIRRLFVPTNNSNAYSQQDCYGNALFVSLDGESTIIDDTQNTTNGGTRRMLFSPSDGVSSVSMYQRTLEMDFAAQCDGHFTLDTLPVDLCFCKYGSESGRNPTAEVFATFLNQTGKVVSAVAADVPSCQDPRVFSQTIYGFVMGDLNNATLRGQLEQRLQDSLNSLSVDKCVDSHFYVYSMELVWWQSAQGNSYDIVFEAKFVSYNNVPGQDTLFQVSSAYQDFSYGSHNRHRHLGKIAEDRAPVTNNNPNVVEILHLSERELVQINELSTCICLHGVDGSPGIDVDMVNERIDPTTCNNAIPGVNYFMLDP
ncbi:hypothetical protein ACA910_001860 [Epithemia clementina (nom. ined.)]